MAFPMECSEQFVAVNVVTCRGGIPMSLEVKEGLSRRKMVPGFGVRTQCFVLGVVVTLLFGYLIHGIYQVQLETGDEERLGALAVEVVGVLTWELATIAVLLSGFLPWAYKPGVSLSLVSLIAICVGMIVHTGAETHQSLHSGRITFYQIGEIGLFFLAVLVSGYAILIGYFDVDERRTPIESEE